MVNKYPQNLPWLHLCVCLIQLEKCSLCDTASKKVTQSGLRHIVLDVNVCLSLCHVWSCVLPIAIGANKVETKSRHLIHMTSEVDLEVDVEVLPAEPRQSCGELFLSQLSVPDTIQACKLTHTDLLTWVPYQNKFKLPYLFILDTQYLYKVHTLITYVHTLCIKHTLTPLQPPESFGCSSASIRPWIIP